jgi:hypothetical protein
MARREVALMLGIAASVASVPADAGADFPVYVVVVGHGTIRIRLAAGRVTPCDSHENRLLFEGPVRAGTYTWETGSEFVCFQHTSRALPEQDWSASQLIPTVWNRKPTEIRVSTD